MQKVHRLPPYMKCPGRHLSVIAFKSKFNPPKSVLRGAGESMARCRLLLASVASETRCSLALKQGAAEAGRGWAFQLLNSPCLSRPLWEVRTLQ